MVLFKNALLSNGKIRDILVKDARIHKIDSQILVSHATLIDCEGRLLLSGMIDLHVHFRDPGFSQKETAETGTKAALRGGVTSIFDMPNTNPLCVSPAALKQKKEIYREFSYVNYGFYFGGDARNNSVSLPDSSEFLALKIFLNESTGHMLIEDDSVLDTLFSRVHYIAVHAEGDAIEKAIYFARKHGNTLYLCHVSQESELSCIRKAKSQGLSVFAELCPHHVFFNESHETDLLLMKPRLRTSRDQNALLEALDSSLIDTWGTDHAPHLINEKYAQKTYGIPSIEFSLELLLTLSKEMNWPLSKVENLYSRNPQRIFKIKNKAFIQEGWDADFVLVEVDTSYTITQEDIVSKCGWSPYVGHHLTSKIHSTYIAGDLLYSSETKKFKKSRYVQEVSYVR